MEPAISEGSWVVALKAGFRRREPARFDVIRLEDPRSSGHWIMKRIVGLPGEEVALRSGELFVGGEAVTDPFGYCPDPVEDNHEWWPRDDEYVVLGDNRMASTDSRKFGPVNRSSFRGRVRG
jgi:signal peptidase I